MNAKTRITRRMWSTPQFFEKPGVAEKLLRDEKMQFRHTTPVLVINLTPEAIYELERRACRAVSENPGSHRDTIAEVLGAIGITTKPSTEV